MTTYYKAVTPDGTDFHSGTIDYGAAFRSGGVVRHSVAERVRDDASTYLSVSVSPSDCTGFQWPCRLFRVEPVGGVMDDLSASKNKRAVSALRVVEELPAHESFGPYGEAVAAVIERASRLTREEAIRISAAARAAAWDAAWVAARAAAWDAAWVAARAAAWDAARDAAWAAAWDAAWDAAWVAARAAALAAVAVLVRDLISEDHFRILTEVWVSVCGPL